MTDVLNRSTSYTYDDAGRMKTVTLPDTRVIQFNYDANGNVTSITPPGRTAHTYTYNDVDVATYYTPPALNAQPVATRYDYNLDKQVTKATRPDGKVIDYDYQANGRLTTITSPSGVIQYGYTTTSGQLSTVTAPGGVGLAYSYDGDLHTSTQFTGPITGTISTGYDNFFRVSEVGVNGSTLFYYYDDDGLLTGAGALSLTRNLSNGFVTGSLLGQIESEQTYNSFGEVDRFTVKQGTNILFQEVYEHNAVSLITRKDVTVAGQTNNYRYEYNNVGRLSDVTKDGTLIGHFEYDDNGNRTLAYGVSAQFDAQDRLTSFGSEQYSYTENGELKQIVNGSEVTDYTYDVFGSLTRVDLPGGGRVDYLVDGLDRRIGKKVNGTLVQGFLYVDQLKIAAELDGANNVISRFVYGGKENVPEYMIKGGARIEL